MSPSLQMFPSTGLIGESGLMGWNGLSPIAPGQSTLLAPASAQGTVPPAKPLPSGIQPLPSESLLGSQVLGSSPREETTDIRQPNSSNLASQGKKEQDKDRIPLKSKVAEKALDTGSMEGIGALVPPGTSLSPGNTVSSRLRSQDLSSSGNVVSSQPRSGTTSVGAGSMPGGVGGRAATLPSKRFHGGTPGESRRPDYTYQYQGSRRYSVGESEYGTGNTYQSLPYYRRKR